MQTKNCNVVLFDSCPLTQLGISALCSFIPDYALVLVTSSFRELENHLEHNLCDILIIDIVFNNTAVIIPGVFSFIERIHHASPEINIIILSGNINALQLYNHMYKHPWRLLHKSVPLDQLSRILIHSQKLANMVTQPRYLITPKQHKVLQLIMRGLSNYQIGLILNCSSKTVSSHKINALRKIGISYENESGAIHPSVLNQIIPTLLNEPRCLSVNRLFSGL